MALPKLPGRDTGWPGHHRDSDNPKGSSEFANLRDLRGDATEVRMARMARMASNGADMTMDNCQ